MSGLHGSESHFITPGEAEERGLNAPKAGSAECPWCGRVLEPRRLLHDRFQERLDQATGGTVKLTEDIRDYYRKYGGTPHLDGQYTVFGEVVEGLDVVRKINYVQTDDYARPVDDVRIVKATVVK